MKKDSDIWLHQELAWLVGQAEAREEVEHPEFWRRVREVGLQLLTRLEALVALENDRARKMRPVSRPYRIRCGTCRKSVKTKYPYRRALKGPYYCRRCRRAKARKEEAAAVTQEAP